METKSVLDLKKFMLKQAENITSSIKFCYPGGNLCENRVHAQLQAIQSSVDAIIDLLSSVETEKIEVKIDKPSEK